jgi:uncharacterized protein YbjT (DUF2867 family)
VILVCGATGRQGGAVARSLLRRGQRVRALTRDPAGPKAAALRALGAEVQGGDLEIPPSLDAAMAGVVAVFSVQNFWDGLPAKVLGYEGEIRQARNLIDAAQRHGVGIFVQSTAAGIERPQGVRHFESKREIENILRQRLPDAILSRPAFFMEHFAGTGYPGFEISIAEGKIVTAIDAGKPLQLIATDDIGEFVAALLSRPEGYVGRDIDIAGDAPTIREAAAVLSEALGKPIEVVQQAPAEVKGSQMMKMAAWFNDIGYHANIPAFREVVPRWTSFAAWVARHRAAILAAARPSY